MSRINGYVTIESIVESVIRNTDDHYDIDLYDASEWAAEAMGIIGLLDSYEFKVYTIEIEAQKGQLPFGCVNVLGVRDATTGMPINKATDTFFIHPSNAIASLDSDIPYDHIDLTSDVVSISEDTIDEDAIPTYINSSTLSQHPTYYINGGYIYCNFYEGEVEIAYTSYPIDERGLPMIPDETNYKKAIMSYIRYMMDYRLWRKKKLDTAIKVDSEQEWMFYSGAAFTKNNTNIADMENIFKGMVKIASDQNAADYAFKFLGQRNVTNY